MVVGGGSSLSCQCYDETPHYRPTHRATPEVEERGEAGETRPHPGGDWGDRPHQAPHRGELQHPHQLQLVSHVLGQVRVLGFISPPVTLHISSDGTSLSSGGSDCPPWQEDKIRAGGGGLTEISSNRGDTRQSSRIRDNSRGNEKDSNRKTTKTVGGKENDLVDHKEGVKSVFQVCL